MKTTSEYIEEYLSEVADITKKIDRKEIEKAINILFDAWKNGKRIYLMGCGGSASAASHFAADLSKTAIVPEKRLKDE